jgi:anti-sigma B factor antagonist
MAPDHFKARTLRDGDRVVVRLEGELDMSGTFVLEPALDELIADAPAEVVFDLRELEFVDSTGLAALIGAHERLQSAGATTRYVRGTDDVQRIFAISGFDGVLDFVDGT